MELVKNAAFILIFFSAAPLAALDGVYVHPSSAEINPYLDPAFHDYVETTDGYLNPKYAPGNANDFRDSPTSFFTVTGPTPPQAAYAPRRGTRSAEPDTAPAVISSKPPARKPAPGRHYKVTFAGDSGPISSFVNPLGSEAVSGFKVGDYTFISVLPRTGDNSAVLSSLEKDGFKFAGEKTYFTAEGKKTYILGWVSYSRLERVNNNPLVLRMDIETRSSGTPFRARIRFTLRAPGGENSAVFVDDFVRNLGSSAGFSVENISRLPSTSGSSKFTAFEITGSLPVDMVASVSRSPFVAAMELQDQAL